MYVLWSLHSLMILVVINLLTIKVDEDLTLQYFPSKVSLFALVFLLIYCCSIPQLYPTLSNPKDCNMPDFLSFSISWSLLKLMSIELVIPSNHLVLCHPLLLPWIFPSIRVFPNKLALRIRWPKYWSFIWLSLTVVLIKDDYIILNN